MEPHKQVSTCVIRIFEKKLQYENLLQIVSMLRVIEVVGFVFTHSQITRPINI